MSKNKIVILAVCAVLVIGGAVAAVPVLRNRNAAQSEDVSYLSSTQSEETSGEYDFPSYAYDLPETVTDENGSVISDSSSTAAPVNPSASASTAANGSVLTTVKQVATTVANAATTRRGLFSGTTKAAQPAKTTTTKAAKTTTTTKKSGGSAEGFVKDAIGEDAQQSFLGYRWSDDGYYYCDDKDCWQKNVGYNEVYDKWAPVAAMHIDQVRIRFQYNNKNYMIQFWKGQYGFLLIGAEIGIYTCGLNEYSGNTGDINHFNCADKEDWLYMQLDCYYSEGGKGPYKRIFTRPYDLYWWATGFVKGQLTKYTAPRTELKTRNRITFKSEEQANIFVQGLKLASFVRAAAADQLVDDSYFASGKDVYVLWSTKNHDCFVGYGDKAQSF